MARFRMNLIPTGSGTRYAEAVRDGSKMEKQTHYMDVIIDEVQIWGSDYQYAGLTQLKMDM